MMISKILVPLDGSDLAEYALPLALRLARQQQAALILLHVAEPHVTLIPEGPDLMGQALPFGADDSYGREDRAAQEYVAGLKQNMRRSAREVAWQVQLQEGDAAGCIIDTVAATGVDLVVMSTHGYSGVTRWVLGSVTEKVLRHVVCPVLVVRQPNPIQHILITLDGSPLAEASLEPGFALAAAFDADVTLLRVDDGRDDIDHQSVSELNAEESGLGERFKQQFYARSDQYLQTVQAAHTQNGLVCHTAVRTGKPAPTILDFAQMQAVDLIVMSTHGRTGLSRWRYGSVTEKVLRGTDRALFIFRPDFEKT